MRQLAFALAVLLPAMAGAEGASLDAVTQGWSSEQRAQAQKSVDALAGEGLERGAALDRIQEWEAKGADSARVLGLLDGLRQAASGARAAIVEVGLVPSSALVESATAARMAGVEQGDLARVLRGSASPEDASGRCLALSTLASSGFAPQNAADVVHLAAERGYSRSDLLMLVSSAQRLAREGVAPHEVLGQVGSALQRGVRAIELYPTVMHTKSTSARPAPEAGFNHAVLRNGP